MSATIAGALKAHIETLGLNVVAYRDQAPTEQTGHYIVIHEGISTVRETDQGDAHAATELVQVDYFQPWRASDGSLAENPASTAALITGIQGAQLATAPKRVYGCLVDSSQRFVEHDTNRVHEAITVRIRRNL